MRNKKAEVFQPESINLDRLISLCIEKNVDVLFICMPCNENAQVFLTLNCFEEYFRENGLTYLNIAEDETFLDYSTDFSDTSHLNYYGSLKITGAMGEYYLEHYQRIPVKESTKDNWDKVLAEYKALFDMTER